jgi:AAA domain
MNVSESFFEPQQEPDDPLLEDPPRVMDGPVFTDLREIEARDVQWLDRPFLPAAELVTNNADGGTGKGLLSVYYASLISRGELGEQRMVIFAVAEDAFDTTLKPRLLAAGADLAYVRAVGWRRKGFNDAILIPDDVPELEQHIKEMQAGLLVVDPLLSHLSRKTNSHTDHEVKVALQPLVDLAQRTGCTVLGNGHFGKDKTRGAVSSAQGSNAFTNTPRVALAMAHDDDDPDLRIVEVIKSNFGAKGTGRNYRVQLVTVDGLKEQVPVLCAEGAASKCVDDLLVVTTQGKRVPAELIREVVLRELGEGEQTRKHLDDAVKEETGANADSVYKSALDPLKNQGLIRARKAGTDGGWFWHLTNPELGC